MNPTPQHDAGVPLRDARLARALEHAPDTLEPAPPAAAMRDAILRAAHEAVDVPQAPPAVRPRRGWRAAGAGVWDRLMGTGRMPWNAALATVLLAGFITVLWRDEPVPSAQTDQPVTESPMRADQQKEAPAAPSVPVAPQVSAESARSTDSAGLAANRAAAPAAGPERARRPQEGAVPLATDMPPVAAAPPMAAAPPAPVAPAPASSAAEVPQAAPPAQAPAPSIAPERAMQQEKSVAARRSAAVSGLATGAAGGGVPQDWTELRGTDGVAVARTGTGELPRLLESLHAEAAVPDARADSLARAEGEPVVRVDLLRAGQLLGSLELAGRRWRFTPQPGGGTAASQGVLGEAEAQVLRAAMQQLQR